LPELRFTDFWSGGRISARTRARFKLHPAAARIFARARNARGIIFLVLAPYNQNKIVRFHAFQSIFMHVAVIACYIALGILAAMLRSVGTFGLGILYPLLSFGAFLLWLYMMWSAYNNKLVVLPIIGELAQKQA
jgi:uncharacterized membrane protein